MQKKIELSQFFLFYLCSLKISDKFNIWYLCNSLFEWFVSSSCELCHFSMNKTQISFWVMTLTKFERDFSGLMTVISELANFKWLDQTLWTSTEYRLTENIRGPRVQLFWCRSLFPYSDELNTMIGFALDSFCFAMLIHTHGRSKCGTIPLKSLDQRAFYHPIYSIKVILKRKRSPI